jgi:hypothetical protein
MALAIQSALEIDAVASPVPPVPFTISQLSELNFGEAPQGDWAKEVFPGTAPASSLGTFLVTGPKGQCYTLLLPTSPLALETHGPGTGPGRIDMSGFRSIPQAGPNGQLDASGRQLITVGARRGPLAPNQRRGRYSGTYFISIIF